MSVEIDCFVKYEIIGFSGRFPSFLNYLKQKYPSFQTDPYGSHLFDLFLNQEISQEEYIRLIVSGEWIASEMIQYGPGWGMKWLISNVDTSLIADEIKKAGGLLISLCKSDLYENPTGIDEYEGFDLSFNRDDYPYTDDSAPDRLLKDINRLLSEKAVIQ